MYYGYAKCFARTLTARQRELLQQYADDVEGRVTPSPSRQEPRQEAPQSAPVDGATPSGSRASTEPEKHTNGTDSSPSAPPGGWVSRTVDGIRRLIGF